MAAESTEMDSLFEGMDFVMPSEDENELVADADHDTASKLVQDLEVEQEGSQLDSSHLLSKTISIPPRISLGSLSSVSVPSRELTSSKSSTSFSSLPPTGNTVSFGPAPASPSHGSIFRDKGEPLDENLFSGLTLSSTDDMSASEPHEFETPITVETTSTTDKATRISSQHDRSRYFEQPLGGEERADSDKSVESIMAGFIDVSPYLPSVKYSSSGTVPVMKPSVSSISASLSSRPSMRRKKRSMKIGYGREEEENEELALRKVAIGEAVGGSIVQKELLNASSSSISIHDRSWQSSQDTMSAEESASEPSLGIDTEVSDSVALVTDPVDIPQPRVSRTSVSENNGPGPGTEKVLNIFDLRGSLVVDKLDGSEDNPHGSDIANHDLSIDEKSHISAIEVTDSEINAVAEASGVNLGICPTNMQTGAAVSRQDETGRQIEGSQEEEVDIEAVARNRERTIEERLTYVKDVIAHKMKVLNSTNSAVSALRKAAVQKRRKAAELVSVTSARFKELEAELNAACEREDFETADAVSGNVATVEKDMSEAVEALRVAEAESDAATLKVQEVLDLQVAIEEKGVKLLEVLKQEAEDVADRVFKEAQEVARQETERLAKEENNTEFRKKKLDIGLRAIEEASAELNKSIEDLTKSECEEKYALTMKRNQLDGELQDLISLVRAKEVEIAEYDRSIAAVDEKMSSVVSTFEKQQSVLDAELENLSASALQLEDESNLIAAGRQRVELILAGADEERNRLANFAQLALDAGRAMGEAVYVKKGIALASMLSRKKRSELVCKEKQAQEEAQMLRESSSSRRALLQELMSMKVKLNQELGTAKDRVIFVEKRGPELDAEKKLAAAARNFKVAGRLAAEAKILTAEKEAAFAEMIRINKELEKVEKEAEAILMAMTDLENQVTAKEKEAGMAQCERLRLVAAAARDERDAAIELEDFQEAESLDSEAKAADAEADQIQRLYQLDGSQFESQSNSWATEDGNLKTRDAALADCERLRMVAAEARDEMDAALELEKFEDARVLHHKAEDADAEADKLQRLYQPKGMHYDRQNTLKASPNVVTNAREVAVAKCERLRLVAASARKSRDAAVELDDFDEAEIQDCKAEAADAEADEIQWLYKLEGSQFESQSSSKANEDVNVKPTKEATEVNYEPPQVVAATSDDDRDTVVEVQNVEAEILHSKTHVNGLQRLSYTELRKPESPSNSLNNNDSP